MGTKADQRRRTIFYQYRADRAKRTLKGIDTQIAKAEKAVAGPGRGQAEPVRPAHRRHQDDQPGPRGQGPRPGRAEGLRHQPARTDPGVRDGRLPPAVADREELPHVQVRPAGPADLPPQTRLDRGPPHHRDGRPRRRPARRSAPPAGASPGSSRPYAATAPSPSRPATRPSPPPTRSPATPSTHSPDSAPQQCALNGASQVTELVLRPGTGGVFHGQRRRRGDLWGHRGSTVGFPSIGLLKRMVCYRVAPGRQSGLQSRPVAEACESRGSLSLGLGAADRCRCGIGSR